MIRRETLAAAAALRFAVSVKRIALLVTFLGFGSLALSRASAQPAWPADVPPCPSKVAAFYYVWYGNKENGWRHWLDADPNFPHDPNHVIATGVQYPGGIERDIAAADYPLLGPYHSQDAVTDAPATPLDVSPADPYLTVDQHLAWAATSGIDVLISSWWGIGTYEDKGIEVLL